MRIRLVHLLSTIRANLVAFCSIALFVALGAGLFLGIGWSAASLRRAVGTTFEDGVVHDVEIQFSAGLTGKDVEAIDSIEGVDAVQGRYQTHVIVTKGTGTYTMRVTSLTDDIDRVRLVLGSLPTQAGEVALQRSLAERAGIELGDVLVVRDKGAVADGAAVTTGEAEEAAETADEGDDNAAAEDAPEEGEGEGEDTSVDEGEGDEGTPGEGTPEADRVTAIDELRLDAVSPELATASLKVVALVDAPEYLSNESSMIGVCDVGVGTVDFVGFVADDAFDEASREYYSGIVATLTDPVTSGGAYDPLTQTAEDTIAQIKDTGEARAQARIDAMREEAAARIADTEAALDAGREQVVEGQTSLEESERRLKEAVDELVSGQMRLEEAQAELAEKQAEGERALDEARAEIDGAQATLDGKAAEVAAAEERIKEYEAEFAEVAPDYDAAMASYRSLSGEVPTLSAEVAEASAKLDAYEAAVAAEAVAATGAEGTDEAQGTENSQAAKTPTITRGGAATPAAADDAASRWREFEQSYGRLSDTYNAIAGRAQETGDTIERISAELDMGVSVTDVETLPTECDPETARGNVERAREGAAALGELAGTVDGASLEVEGATVRLTDVRAGLSEARSRLDDAKGELEAGREKLRQGRQEFNEKKAQFEQTVNEGRAQLRESARKLEEGRETVGNDLSKLDDGKSELSRAERELKEGEGRLADAKDAVVALDGLGWIVTTRSALGAWRGPDIVATMLTNVRWAMASVFVIVGLLVCYSAVSRIVYAEMTQVGTLFAMGFPRARIAVLYLAFAASAVIVGMALSVPVAFLVVEGNVNPAMARSFAIGQAPYHWSVAELVAMAAFELATVLLAAWLAVRSLLRLEARDLVVGEAKGADTNGFGPTRALERLAPWARMTILNLLGDTRRVVATLIGVCGCTALIVIGLTLDADVSATPVRHYERVYDFDAIAYLDGSDAHAAEEVRQALADEGVRSAPVFLRQMMVNLPDGSLTFATVVVSLDDEAFSDLYHLAAKGQPISWLDDGQDGLWVSTAFTEHRGWGTGDELRLIGADGLVADVTIAGTFDYYLLKQEFVCSQRTWEAACGAKAQPNALLVDTAGHGLEEVYDKVAGVDGFERISDDRGDATFAFQEVSGLLKVIVAVFLTLSALMAALVLFSLDVLYVSERRRELTVLMVSGFTVRAAKAYIWRDSLALTVVGIAFGLVVGCGMAGVILRALEPVTGNFVRDVNWPSVGVGTLVSAVFATVAMLLALREISRFNLCDVNRD